MKLIKGARWGEAWTNFIPGDINWAEGPLYGLDLETTSVDVNTARIVQCGIVLDIPGNDPVTWDLLVNPGISIPLGATAIHGINDETVQRNGLEAAQAIYDIMTILSKLKSEYPDVPLVAVNAPYDLTILANEMLRHTGTKLEARELPPVIDTLCCDRCLDPYRPGRRTLTAASAAYGIAIHGAHNAVNDIICSLRLVRAMARKYPRWANADLASLQQWQTQAYEDWADNFELYQRMDDPEFSIDRGWPIRS